MKALVLGARVKVAVDVERKPVHAVGLVTRLLSRGPGAWVTLDKRCGNIDAHPFAETDPRGRDVLAFAEDCEAVEPAKSKGGA